MKYSKLLTLGTVATIALSLSPAHADQYNRTAGAPFTSHHLVEGEKYKEKVQVLPADEKLEVREYLDYETREPCQSYQPLPQGFMRDGCKVVPIVAQQETVTRVVRQEQPAPAPVAVNNVLSNYEINFALDSSVIETEANNTLDRIASEIKQYNPREVTVAGHTDTSGSAEYNQALSERRAQAVSEALTARGVQNRVLDMKAFGQNNLAVPTADEVVMRENRRVVIEFLK